MTDHRPSVLLPPKPAYALFSGGKDSFACASVLHEAGLLAGCVLIDTGIAIPEWKAATSAMCEERGWAYEIIPTTHRYEWIVWKYGFPGRPGHKWAMDFLKGRAVSQWRSIHCKTTGTGKRKLFDGSILASGCRMDESERRLGNTKPISEWEKVTVYSPIFEWTTAETWAYVKERGYVRPRAYETLGISGDCLCGAFAKEYEREAIRVHHPSIHADILRMEHEYQSKWGAGSKACGRIKKQGTEAVGCADCGDADMLPLQFASVDNGTKEQRDNDSTVEDRAVPSSVEAQT